MTTVANAEAVYQRILPNIHGGKCWSYSGRHQVGGYPRVRAGGKRMFVYRVVYEALVGPVPDGMVLDHLCRNRSCVNPEHLEPVSFRTNVLRGEGPTAVNARKTHCIHGHEFTPANTKRRGAGRVCLTCTAPLIRGPNLSGEQADEIRRRYAAGHITQAALGAEYGVSQACVSDIVRERTWK